MDNGYSMKRTFELRDIPKVEPTAAIAVDVGTTHYLTTSEGEKLDNPRWYCQAEGLLRKHSKDLSRKKLGSNRRKKQQHKLALHHERTKNRRKDFIGKLVYKLYHHLKNNVLVAEDLQVSNMVQNKHLSKSIADASWGIFFRWCEDIAERDGLHFHTDGGKSWHLFMNGVMGTKTNDLIAFNNQLYAHTGRALKTMQPDSHRFRCGSVNRLS